MKNRKWLTGPRLANTSNPDRLAFHSLTTKGRRYLQLLRRQAGSLLASDMQQELLHRVLYTHALERSFLLPANPHMGLNCSKERETSQFRLFTVHHDSTPPPKTAGWRRGESPPTAANSKLFQHLSQWSLSSSTQDCPESVLSGRFPYQAP